MWHIKHSQAQIISTPNQHENAKNHHLSNKNTAAVHDVHCIDCHVINPEYMEGCQQDENGEIIAKE